ncbi:hypothetical protein B4125_1737 [Bacillus paralicheniformis]|nr:hypothetical protein SC10_B2orf03281 [Bacillus paralicheniformis]OLG07556.1 hypothetical protein B4125_1737 [Bacillus paralicheniformis]TWK28226.1 hypothetical protein CHCC20372_0861 [Bacillus paralicheniformis]TWM02656.1 hypothetical protein CHCC15136_3345 [Bacillus paralicheniformis]TWM49263.1 hypothetical protein CHCC14817_3139 [Bacillus paralicheniformis]
MKFESVFIYSLCEFESEVAYPVSCHRFSQVLSVLYSL